MLVPWFPYVQFSSVTQSCPTLCDLMDCSTPGLLSITNSQSLLTLMSIETVMTSNHLIPCRPLLLLPSIFPSIRVKENGKGTVVNKKCYQSSEENKWMEEPGGLQSMGSWRVGHDWATSLSFFTFMYWRRKWQPIPVFLPGESQGRGSLVGCRLWGLTESDTTETT